MKVVFLISACLSLAALTSAAHGQFVKGNEAVKVMPDGGKRVETPPLPAATLASACPAARAGCAGGGRRSTGGIGSITTRRSGPRQQVDRRFMADYRR
jgi:hypothetical protein